MAGLDANESLTSDVRRHASALGFDLVGIADASLPLDEDFRRYESFVDAGMHGSMEYLARHRAVRERLDTEAILEGARSVICVAERYAEQSFAASEGVGEDRGVVDNIARYARGRDYHDHLRQRLRALAAYVRKLVPDARARPMTDTAPVLERAWARRAGLGFVGKNGLLIVPGVGSFVVLGEVVTTALLRPDAPIHQRCGACRRCLDACPTQAFVAPFVLDARRCVAYLTIENRGETEETLRSDVGEHLFGCDVCQEVCPYNHSPREHGGAEANVENAYEPRSAWANATLESIAEQDDVTYRALTKGSAVRRAGHLGLARNAITVLANRHDARYRTLFERIAAGATESWLREHARWAIAQLDASLRDVNAEDVPRSPSSENGS